MCEDEIENQLQVKFHIIHIATELFMEIQVRDGIGSDYNEKFSLRETMMELN